MSTKIRLRRMGRSKRPVYSIVVIDSRKSRDSSFIEDLGRYYPLREPAEVVLQEERALHWLRTGAQASDTVRGIFSERGLMLRLHLERKGKDDDEIQQIVSDWKEERSPKDDKFVITDKAERQEQETAAVDESDTATETAGAETAAAEEETEEEAEAEAADADAEAETDESAQEEESDVETVHEAQAEASSEEAEAASEEEAEEAKQQQDTEG